MAITIHDILLQYPPTVFSLGLQLRDHLISKLPNIIEMPDASANIVGYGYGFAYQDLICTIIPSNKGIKLGFYKGSKLPDPGQLLTGAGKVHKYVEIKTPELITSAHLNALISAAVAAYKQRIA
ncbi:MAG TPA: hypothetical protein VGE90_10755 [Chitinophaga sp.]